MFDVSEGLRLTGWQVPAYTLAPNLQDTTVLRIVVRNGFGKDLAQLLTDDLRRVVEPPRRGSACFRPTPSDRPSTTESRTEMEQT